MRLNPWPLTCQNSGRYQSNCPFQVYAFGRNRRFAEPIGFGDMVDCAAVCEVRPAGFLEDEVAVVA
jgi:hypothetical protein